MRLWQRLQQILARGLSKQNKTFKDGQLRLESLEARSLLASHPLVDAPDVDYVVTDEWSTGHTADVTISNDEGNSFSNWRLEFDHNGEIGDLWNAEVTNLGDGRYAITPPSWDTTLDAGESLSFGFSATGPSGISNLSFSASEQTNPGPTPPVDDTPVSDPIAPPAENPITPPVDNDPNQLPIITISDAQVAEGDSGFVLANFTVSLSKASAESVTVDFHTMTNTASSGYDFERTEGTVSFAAGETSQTIDVRVYGDLAVEGDERFEVMLTTPSGATFGDSNGNDQHVSIPVTPGEPLDVPTTGTFGYLNGEEGSRVLDLTSTGAHNTQLMVSSSGNLIVLGPFNGNPIQQHETPLADLIANTSVDFLETRTPDPEEDPNQMIGIWMQDPIGGLQISNAHLYCDAAGLFLGEKLGIVGGQSDQGYVVTSHRMDESGVPLVNVIDGFDPATDKLDFQYFSNREFAVADSSDGVVISASPQAYNAWGEKTLIRGITFDQLNEGNFIFRFEQKYEDGFNRFGGTSENTPTDGTREIPFVSSPLNSGTSNPSQGTTAGGDFSYEVGGTWDTGYVSNWTYAPQAAVGAWQITIQIDGEINSIWNAEIYSQEGGVYVIGNSEFNGGIPTGQTLEFGFEATGSSSSIQILSGDENQVPADDSDNAVTTGWETHIIGDSIAVGLQYQNPSALGYALVGSNPTVIYNEILAGNDQLDGARVLLSSGIMNNTSDFSGVENQLQYLTEQGASVRLVGAADGNYDSHNAQLAALAEQYGVMFMGGFTPGADGVHPPNYQYADLYTAVSTMDANDGDGMDHDGHSDMPHDGADMITGVLSGFGTIIDDDLPGPSIPPIDETPVDPPADPVDPPAPPAPPADPIDPPVDDTPVDTPVNGGSVQVSDIEIIEGDNGTSQAIFTVTRASSDAPITLSYVTEDGGAVVGEDYLAAAGTVTLAAGQSSTQIAVTIFGDTQFEADETFTLRLQSVETETPPVAVPETPQDQVEQPVVAAYFPEWGIYGRDYKIADVPGDDLTHFIYAFANLTAEGEMVLFDSFAATEKRFAADESVSGEADLWDYPADDPRSQQTVWGNFNQVAQLKAKFPHLRTSIAIGGWTLSGNFSNVCATAEGRETLANSISEFLNTYTMFDGIDFDWEYPGGGGLGGNSESPQDGANYASLLEVVREKLDQLGAEKDRYYEITVASPGGYEKVAKFNVAGVNQHIDFFNVMTYDFHGTWENSTGHQAALTNDPNGYDIETSVNLYLDAGVPAEKIILGAPAYTRAWNGVADGGDNGYDEAASGAAPGSFEAGNYDYKDLASQYLAGTGDWELNWDDDAQAAYLFSESQGVFSSFETPGSISLKSEWAQDLGLGGMMFWDLSSDATGNESLISTAADSWFAGKTFAEITGASDLVFDNIYGGNGIFDPVVEVNTTPSIPHAPVNGTPAVSIDVSAAGTIINDDDAPAAPPVDDTPVTPPVDETPVTPPVSDPAAPPQIVDNGSAGFSQQGFSYLSNGQVSDAMEGDVHMLRRGTGIASWEFTNLEDGEYRIATTWAGKYSNKYNAVDAPYTISDANENVLVQAIVNQTETPEDFQDAGKGWHILGTVTVTDGTIKVSVSEGTNANQYVVADAVRIERVSTGAPVDDTPVAPPVDDTPVAPPVDDTPVTPPVDETPVTPPVSDPAAPPQIVDNGSAGFSQQGFSYLSNGQVSDAMEGDVHMLRRGTGIASWEFTNLEDGEYRIATTWAGKYSNKYNAVDAPYTISDANENVLVQAIVNQTETPEDFQDAGKGWHILGTVTVTDGTIKVSVSEGTNANQYVVADAVRIERVSTGAPVDDTPVAPPVDNTPVAPPVDDTPVAPPVDETPSEGTSLDVVASTTSVSVLVDSDTGLAYVQEEGSDPILITRSDDYFDGNVPLTRGDATILAAARDDSGRLRVLDGGGTDVYAWILNNDGLFIGEEGPSATSINEKETLFQFDIDGDGTIGEVAPPVDDTPAMPPMEDHEGHDDHDHMAPPADAGDYIDITTWGNFHGSNNNSEHHELVGGRTAITTEAMVAYNNLRAFLGLSELTIEEVGQWAFDESLTNNSTAWGNDLKGVGLWYAMQGAKVGWIADEAYDPQILADIQRTARLVADPVEMEAAVMNMVRQFSHDGFADYLEQYDIVDTFISTLKMEPHYGGWMHGRTHGFRSIEGVAINHDINHLTVLSWDQMQPFMNDTFDWPQWPALDVSDSGVIEYYQSIVTLGNPVGQNMESAPAPVAPPVDDTPVAPPVDDTPVAPPVDDTPAMPPMDDHSDHDHGDTTDPVAPPVDDTPAMPPMDDMEDHDDHDHMAPPADAGDYIDITTWGNFHGSNNNSEHHELVGGRTAITTEAMVAYNNLRAFLGLSELTIEEVGQWAFDESLTNNSTAWGNDLKGVGLWYAMQGAKVGWIADEAYDPQILADIQRTARLVADPVEMEAAVMNMVRQFSHDGFADYLEQYDIVDTFISTLKMEPHYGGWMHGRTHGFRSIEGVAINHDINHLTVLSWDQMQPFMNDTFDWPQWPALDVSDSGVIEYYQSIVTLGNPVGQNMESAPAPVAPPVDDTPVAPPVDDTPVAPPVDDTPVAPPVNPGDAPNISLEVTNSWDGGFNGDLTVRNTSNDNFDGWLLEFTYTGQIDYIWNASLVSQDGDRYVITNEDWNGQVAAGDDVTFGFTITGSQDVLPSDIVFYGKNV